MFIFLLTPFDAWDLYYLGLNLSQVLLIKALFINKACNVFSFLKKWRNNFTARVYFFVSSVFIWGDIVRKVLPKAGGLEKIQKKGGGGLIAREGSLSIEVGIQTFCTLWFDTESMLWLMGVSLNVKWVKMWSLAAIQVVMYMKTVK